GPGQRARNPLSVADADRSNPLVHRQGIVREHLRAGVPGEGSRARARCPQGQAAGREAQDCRAGDRQAGARRLHARCVRRSRQQAADYRGVREVHRGGEGHPGVLPCAAMMRTRGITRIGFAAGLLAAALLSTIPGEAHKAITSKYTYNDDVFPILRDRCSRCHVAGGVAPMSLMTYDEAFPWAESIRAELVANHMPPWNAEEGFGALKTAHTLSPRELDIILTWATGGNPRGQLDQKLPPIALKNDWAMGAPDLVLPLPSEFTVAADKMEDWHEFAVSAPTTEARWVRAVDLLPGSPSIVRS